jgi:ParB family transcriptional regulator, chromosome partitioning protein
VALPLSCGAVSPVGSLEGRRRLGGAFLIDLNRIEPDPDQPRKRFDTAAQRELNASVARLGILQPVTVRFVEGRNVYRIITGQRRFEAAKQANLQQLPCWVQTPKDDEVLLHQIVENWQRADMHPFDLADALARLRDGNGYTQKEIAEQTGKSKGEISKLLSLLSLAPDVQKMARDDLTGGISKRHLYAITRLPVDDQRELIRKVQREGLTTTELDRLAARKTRARKHANRNGAFGRTFRFVTSAATVIVTFQKRDVTNADIAEALDEARRRGSADVQTRAGSGTQVSTASRLHRFRPTNAKIRRQ